MVRELRNEEMLPFWSRYRVSTKRSPLGHQLRKP